MWKAGSGREKAVVSAGLPWESLSLPHTAPGENCWQGLNLGFQLLSLLLELQSSGVLAQTPACTLASYQGPLR